MTKDLRNTVIWMICATGIVIMAYWQAQVAVARETTERHKTLPPPAKTKRAIRPAPSVFSGDVVADYVARCEKGMTDQEIGWILEDFRNAGLDMDWKNPAIPMNEVLRFRIAQNRWYLDALADALRLTSVQFEQAAKKIDELFENEKNQAQATANIRSGPGNSWVDITKPFYRDGRDLVADLPTIMLKLAPIPAPPYAPWKLVQLTPEQEKLTWENWFSMIENGHLEISNMEVAKRSGGPLFRSPKSYFEGYQLDGAPLNPSKLTDLILPLLVQQKLIASEDSNDPFREPHEMYGSSTPENARLMHPDQFKLLLLFDPQKAKYFQQMIETAAQSQPAGKGKNK